MKTAEQHNAELTGSIKFLEMPPLPPDAFKFIEEMRKAAEKASGTSQVFADVRTSRP